jgi:hypothetical protein
MAKGETMETKKIDLEQITREFRELRLSLERNPDQPIHAEPILRRCAEIRETIPPEYLDPSRRPAYEGRMESELGFEPATPEEFESFIVHEAVRALVEDLGAAMAGARETARKMALRVYYAGEELARDPQHAHLIPQLEQLRLSYERDYGHPLPPKTDD